ncbi:hypothetical protein JHK82_047968 [Glycine max]|nr:hypothetical protein JHK82_047968 [Glycine max]
MLQEEKNLVTKRDVAHMRLSHLGECVPSKGLFSVLVARDQPTNCRYIYKEWEIGIEIDTNVKREEVEKLVNDFTEGEKGNKMRKKIVELKKKAGEATTPSGCSFMNLDKFIKEVNQSRLQRNLMYLAAIVDSQPQPSPLPGQVHHTVGDITATAFLSASTVVRHAQPTRDKLQWKSRPPHAANVEKVVAMWERRLSLKLLLAALNGKDSAIAMCKFCRLMGTTTAELLLNR